MKSEDFRLCKDCYWHIPSEFNPIKCRVGVSPQFLGFRIYGCYAIDRVTALEKVVFGKETIAEL